MVIDPLQACEEKIETEHPFFVHKLPARAPRITYRRGSDATAAGGGRRELSEWQRSIKSRNSESPKILSGTATGEPYGLIRLPACQSRNCPWGAMRAPPVAGGAS